MVEPQPSKLYTGVRFSSPAPLKNYSHKSVSFILHLKTRYIDTTIFYGSEVHTLLAL